MNPIVGYRPHSRPLEFKMLRFDRSRLSIVITVGLFLAVTGCGSSDRPPLGKVRGTITMDGQPLEGAIVYFSPEGGGRVSQDMTDAKGEYDLVYIGNTAGAKTGLHKVRITTAYEGFDEKTGKSVVNKERVPKRYNSNETELSFEVEPGQNKIDIPLTSAK